ncbi:hypothetical protein, partial [Streptomyces sp. T21Q-yed]|uniref:hypothetical protein n=1 Tax=Streptomyces sp. T21Q-yed TaxID=3018441 RepID=UPI0023E03C0E
MRRIQAEDGRWVRNLSLHLPVRFGDGFHQDMLRDFEARWRQALDGHFNTGLRLPRSGDQLHIDLDLSHVPDHPEAIELSLSPEPGRSDQLHLRMHSEAPELGPAELVRRQQLNDLLGLHEFGHFTGLPDTYYAADSVFRNSAGKSSGSGIMADVIEAPSPGVPAEYLAAIENAADSGPVVRDHPLTGSTAARTTAPNARRTPVDPAEHERFGQFRDELKSMVVRPHPDPERLRQSIGTFLDGVAPQHRADWVREVRQLIDTLPDTQYADESVNIAHRALNPFDADRRAMAVPGAEYVSASRVRGTRGGGFINRDIPEVVVIDREPYVPVYSAVFGDALGVDKPRFKDVGQDGNGVVQIHTGADDHSERVLWVSVGQPLRQIKWIDKYQADNAAEPMIRSFLVPLRVANEISRGAVTEHQSGLSEYRHGEAPEDLNVDKHFASNQFGIRNPRSLEQLRRTALPNSLRTYTDGETDGRPDSWGDVRPISELRGKLGVPNEGMPEYPVFTEGNGFVSPARYEGMARTLREIVAAHHNNPRLRDPGDKYLSRKQVEAYFDRHAPEHLKNGINDHAGKRSAIDVFVRDYVSPWAAQARISQALYDEYEKFLSSNPSEKPVDYSLSEAQPTVRGQRRTADRQLGHIHRAHMDERFAIRSGFDALHEHLIGALQELRGDVPRELRRALGELRKRRGEILDDYQFKIGDSTTLPARNDEYRGFATDMHGRITQALGARQPGAELARVLDQLDRIRSPLTRETGALDPVSSRSELADRPVASAPVAQASGPATAGTDARQAVPATAAPDAPTITRGAVSRLEPVAEHEDIALPGTDHVIRVDAESGRLLSTVSGIDLRVEQTADGGLVVHADGLADGPVTWHYDADRVLESMERPLTTYRGNALAGQRVRLRFAPDGALRAARLLPQGDAVAGSHAEVVPGGFRVTDPDTEVAYHFDRAARQIRTPQPVTRHIRFEGGSHQLSADARRAVDALAAITAQEGVAAFERGRALPVVSISGHGNGTALGRPHYGRAIRRGEQRAEAV